MVQMGQNRDDELIMDCNLRRKEEISNRCDDGGGGVCGLMWSGEKIGVYGATRRSLRIVLSVVRHLAEVFVLQSRNMRIPSTVHRESFGN